MSKKPTAFISYSWDNEEQKEWVTSLVNLLRQKGVVATSDVFQTQKGTVNLNTMMVANIRDSDYTIIVLTEQYAEKADLLQGGVGFETGMLIPYVQGNMQKIIPIMNCRWNSARTVPFYLKGIHYIDFSDQSLFNEKFKELLHRIHGVDMVEEEPVGESPVLTPRKTGGVVQDGLMGLTNLIPDLRAITDLDKNKFMKESFIAIKGGLLELLENTKHKNINFDFEPEDITNRMTIYKIYMNGNQKYAVKVWLGSGYSSGPETINMAYGNRISDYDTSMNEMVTCEVGKDKKLNLKMTMNRSGDKEANSPKLVVIEVWNNILMWLK